MSKNGSLDCLSFFACRYTTRVENRCHNFNRLYPGMFRYGQNTQNSKSIILLEWQTGLSRFILCKQTSILVRGSQAFPLKYVLELVLDAFIIIYMYKDFHQSSYFSQVFLLQMGVLRLAGACLKVPKITLQSLN